MNKKRMLEVDMDDQGNIYVHWIGVPPPRALPSCIAYLARKAFDGYFANGFTKQPFTEQDEAAFVSDFEKLFVTDFAPYEKPPQTP
jgi:hypothetical protein